jgi:hypothetical protein
MNRARQTLTEAVKFVRSVGNERLAADLAAVRLQLRSPDEPPAPLYLVLDDLGEASRPMQYGDRELGASLDVTIPDGVHAGKALAEVGTDWLAWSLTSPGWQRSHANLVKPILVELRRRLSKNLPGVLRELDERSSRYVRPRPVRKPLLRIVLAKPAPRIERAVPAKADPEEKRLIARLAIVQRKVAKAEEKRAAVAHIAALQAELDRRARAARQDDISDLL